jgi:hypothetical protein
MRRRALLLLLSAALLAAGAGAETGDDALQRSFLEGVQQLQARDYEGAAATFRRLLGATDSSRVKLELARALFHLGRYAEAGALFREVSRQPGTPWRVRDNIDRFLREIEQRTGYLKFGLSIVTDSNPRNLTSQREFSIGGVRLTFVPEEEARTAVGLRYSAEALVPLAENRRLAGYLAGAYQDYEGQELDRFTLDAGIAAQISESGRVRARAGIEAGSFGGRALYRFPYVSLAAMLAESQAARVDGQMRIGKVEYPGYAYLDAAYGAAAVSLRRALSRDAALTLGATLERSQARERPYSYDGASIGPGIMTFWPESTLLLGARATRGARRYDEVDPIFGLRRADRMSRIEASVGNKRWRWQDRSVGFLLSTEKNNSSIEFYGYRKTNFTMVVE